MFISKKEFEELKEEVRLLKNLLGWKKNHSFWEQRDIVKSEVLNDLTDYTKTEIKRLHDYLGIKWTKTEAKESFKKIKK